MTIYIIDDHPVIREVLCDYLVHVQGLTLLGVAASGEEAIADDAVLDADVVVADMELPGMSGIELIELLRTKRPGIRCLMLSSHHENAYVRRSLAAGACGYVLKGDPQELATAIRHVADGRPYLSAPLWPGSTR